MVRVSIAGLLGLVVAFAVGLAALIGGSDLWVGATFVLTIGVLLASLLGTILRGWRGGGWLGFSTFGWGFFLLSNAFGLGNHMRELSDPPSRWIFDRSNPPPTSPSAATGPIPPTSASRMQVQAPWNDFQLAMAGHRSRRANSALIGSWLSVLILAAIGSFVGVRMARSRPPVAGRPSTLEGPRRSPLTPLRWRSLVLNVLQLIPTLDRSGAEKQMVLLAKGLPRERFRVEVAALTRLGPLEAELVEAGIPVTRIGKRHKVDPLALGRLVRFLREKRFDVVQTWIYAADTYGRVAARRARVPVVVTCEMAVDLWKGRSERVVDRFLSRWTDRVVGNSDAVVEFYRGVGIPPEKLAMIPSGIADEEPPDVDPAEVRASLGLPRQAPLILFVGRLAEQKGVDTLISTLDLLQHVCPDARTLIVGEGPLRGRLEETAGAFRLLEDRRVTFLGHRGDVPRLLAASDVLVLPSLYEGLPNVVLEAMRFRKPVVATAAPGTTEVVVDGVTGLLVPLRDPPALARAIRRVLDDPTLARSLGEAGRARVEASFGASPMIDRFADLYERLAREKGIAGRR